MKRLGRSARTPKPVLSEKARRVSLAECFLTQRLRSGGWGTNRSARTRPPRRARNSPGPKGHNSRFSVTQRRFQQCFAARSAIPVTESCARRDNSVPTFFAIDEVK